MSVGRASWCKEGGAAVKVVVVRLRWEVVVVTTTAQTMAASLAQFSAARSYRGVWACAVEPTVVRQSSTLGTCR
ncbi:hypothetical protein E2C01_050483 [Portunus trituberculatus]|uniref:Uncharacterized protein n=1 Tax=Portunus trituberculatus TaxID=210409 RepID=A0A5B7G942_PORTR|nr:hypothetical protein [Portunus trituberculatus]